MRASPFTSKGAVMNLFLLLLRIAQPGNHWTALKDSYRVHDMLRGPGLESDWAVLPGA